MTSGNELACTVVKPGYSIVAGAMIVCDQSCKSCSGTGSSDCTDCYAGSVLIGGTCTACAASNALRCLSTNTNFAVMCKKGYTSTFYNNSGTLTGGTC